MKVDARTHLQTPRRVAALLVVGASLPAWASAQPSGVMQDLGALGGPSASSSAEAASSDGSVVVGDSRDGLGRRRAFRWTAASGMQDLGTLGGAESRAYGVSADGALVVGESDRASGSPHAFVWTAAGGMRGLGTSDLARSTAYDCSADGAVIVGEVGLGFGVRRRAFRWTTLGGIEDLGTLGGAWSGARGVSDDGLVIVGVSQTATGENHAFRWTLASGMLDLGALAAGAESTAAKVSADGAVVVGWGDEGVPLYHALRWHNGVLQDLGTLGSSATTAEDVSSDGLVVVGGGLVPAAGHQGRAFRWTAGTGFALLGTLGGNESWAAGVSGDGSTIVGGSATAHGAYHAFRWRSGAASTTCAQPVAGACSVTFETEGAPSLGAAAPFWVRAHALPSGTFATLSYGVGAAAPTPASYGTWCVPGTTTRIGVFGAGSAPQLGPCEGHLAFDFNAWLATASDPALIVGAHVVMQLTYRDVAAPWRALHSAALEFDVAP